MIPEIAPIRTENLLLRAFRVEDFPGYLAYYTGERTGGVGGPLPAHRVFERFCSMIGHWAMRGYVRYAISDHAAGPAFGHVGPMKLTDDAPPEMTWTIWDGARTGKGLATEAAGAVLDHLFANGWTEIVAHIDVGNEASLRMARRLGAVEDTETPGPDWLPDARRFVLRPWS
ncbi:MAG: GNAT family N-acetyltransferase [Pseudomonadota bacterium]